MSLENELKRIADALEKIQINGVLVTSFSTMPVVEKNTIVKSPGRPLKEKPAPVAEAESTADFLDEASAETEPHIDQQTLLTNLRTYAEVKGTDATRAIMVKYGADSKKPTVASIPVGNYNGLNAEITKKP